MKQSNNSTVLPRLRFTVGQGQAVPRVTATPVAMVLVRAMTSHGKPSDHVHGKTFEPDPRHNQR